LGLFLSEMTDNPSIIQTIKKEMLSQVTDFSGSFEYSFEKTFYGENVPPFIPEKSYEEVKRKVNGMVSTKVSESCSTAVRLLLPDDTNKTVAEV